MQPDKQDLTYLWDMCEAAKEIIAFVKGIKFDKFVQKRMIRYAVERQLLVIGEAANHVSSEFQEAHPEIYWRQMVAMRNVLAYEYGEIKVDRVYAAASVGVPELLKVLKHLVPED